MVDTKIAGTQKNENANRLLELHRRMSGINCIDSKVIVTELHSIGYSIYGANYQWWLTYNSVVLLSYAFDVFLVATTKLVYKTQLTRMILNTAVQPYSHCSHAIDNQLSVSFLYAT